jgi:hypothetical protein
VLFSLKINSSELQLVAWPCSSFSYPSHNSQDVPDGYRDIQLSVVHTDENDLSIIGEIQVHDSQLHKLKQKVGGRCLA